MTKTLDTTKRTLWTGAPTVTATLQYTKAQEVKETYQSEAHGLVAVIELPGALEWRDPWFMLSSHGDESMPASVYTGKNEYQRLASITKDELESLKPDSIAHLLEMALP